jgi:hypothetical protein
MERADAAADRPEPGEAEMAIVAARIARSSNSAWHRSAKPEDCFARGVPATVTRRLVEETGAPEDVHCEGQSTGLTSSIDNQPEGVIAVRGSTT